LTSPSRMKVAFRLTQDIAFMTKAPIQTVVENPYGDVAIGPSRQMPVL
jgi:hypothetical protein